MTIELVDTSIFDLTVECLVNPVNCVGVMGAGLAKQFRVRFLDNDVVYRQVSQQGRMKLGRVLMVAVDDSSIAYVANFPTKDHWSNSSRLKDVDSGLVHLRQEVERLEIKSIALPALGCGLGGLMWEPVRELIELHLGELEGTRVVVCVPR